MAHWLAASLCITLAACASEGSDVDGATVDGNYRISSRFDLARSAGLPTRIDEALRPLAALAEAPAEAMLARGSGSDGMRLAVSALAFVPADARPYLAGWIDAYVSARRDDGVPATVRIADLLAETRAMWPRFELVTRLALAGGVGVHTLKAVAWERLGERISVEPSCGGAESESPLGYEIIDGTIVLDDHTLELPLGRLMVDVMDQAIGRELGHPDLSAALEAVIGCDDLARDLAKRCAGEVCVGHEDQLRAFCQDALAGVASAVADRLGDLRVEGLQFRAGAATLHATGPVVDRIDGGLWHTALDLGQGPVPLRSAFEGWRSADEPAAVEAE